MVRSVRAFGTLANGQIVHSVDLSNARLRAVILTHGARLHELAIDGGPNVISGSADLAGYEAGHRYAGPVVGPVVNRIAGATASIANKEYQFEANQDGRHCLHSGRGTQDLVWSVIDQTPDQVAMECALPDGAGGFPGNRRIGAAYRLDGCDLHLELTATTDALTLMNLAHHGVWNLDGTESWEGHTLSVATPRFLPTDVDKIPTGKIADVSGTPYNHCVPRAPDPTLDHNFCFEGSGDPQFLATLTGAEGRGVDILSDAPGLQVYAGGPRGIALEPQKWPDAPHHQNFPSIHLEPGETFRQHTIFRLHAP